MKYTRYLISSAVFYALATFAKIKDSLPAENYGLPGQGIKPGDNEEWLNNFFSKVVGMLQDITAIAAVLGICIVGIMYIMSHGDEEKTEKAKNYIVAILIGTILAFTAWAMISLVNLIPGAIEF